MIFFRERKKEKEKKEKPCYLLEHEPWMSRLGVEKGNIFHQDPELTKVLLFVRKEDSADYLSFVIRYCLENEISLTLYTKERRAVEVFQFYNPQIYSEEDEGLTEAIEESENLDDLLCRLKQIGLDVYENDKTSAISYTASGILLLNNIILNTKIEISVKKEED